MIDKKNYFTTPVIIIFISILVLFFISLLPSEIKILGYQVKDFNLLSDFKDAAEETAEIEKHTKPDNPEILKAGINIGIEDIFIPGKNLAYTAQSINDLIKFHKITGNTEQLKYFYEALKKADKSVVRIAHLGDSIIEGDYISSEVREQLQEKFGGCGIGYEAVVSADTQFRLTTSHEYSDDWKTYSLFGRKSKKYKYSLNGEVFVPSKGSSVNYKMRDGDWSGSNFNILRILYRESEGSSVNLKINGKPGELALKSGSGLLEAVETVAQKSGEAQLKFNPSGSTEVIGVYFEGQNGVQLDNYPYRGNTGSAMTELSQQGLDEINKLMNYKLIILQFGLNAVEMRRSEFKNFKKHLTEGIKKLKKAFPETSFILIGVSDKSRRAGSRFVTDPKIPELIKIQKEAANKTGIAFWNTFEVMGGKNSMAKWVKNKPAYAHSDFTHFNQRGADKIGELFSKALIDGYLEYTK